MDTASTAFTLMKDAYHIIVFIRTVVENAKTMDADTVDIQSQIEDEIGFLETCKLLLFDDNGQFRQPRGLPVASFQGKVEKTARKLLQAMAEFYSISRKYKVVESEGWEQVVGGTANIVGRMAVVCHRVQKKVKEIKKRYLDWGVFDRERVLEVLRVYTGHAHELRATMNHILMIGLAAGDTWFKEVLDRKQEDQWLQEAATRRLLGLQDPPADFDALDWDRFRPMGQEFTTDSDIVHAQYDDHSGQTHSVIVEYRSYDAVLMGACDGAFSELKMPIRKLAWAMQSAFTKADGPGHSSTLRVLPCLGYVDDVAQCRTGFVYRCAEPHTGDEAKQHETLHCLISQSATSCGDDPMPKPSLGERFRLAAELAATVSGIHGFGWVHKGISSHSVIMSNNPDGDGQIPHLIGWCYAREQNGETLKVNPIADRASNLYRHPKRQGHPSDRFTVRHDIYSLGVVLVEIALWKTVDTMCEGVYLPVKIRETLLQRTRDTIPWLMGECYAEAVRRCLEGDFNIQGDQNREAQLGLAFRELVVDVIEAGRGL